MKRNTQSIKVVLLLLLLLPLVTKAQNKCNEKLKQFRYYDFNIVIDSKSFLKEVGYLFIIKNCDVYSEPSFVVGLNKFKKNTLYYITYKHSIDKPFTPLDTMKFDLTNSQLDCIFDLTKCLFTLEKLENKSTTDPNSFNILVPNDGYSGYVVFDLCLKGDRYRIDISNTDPLDSNNSTFKKLISYFVENFKVKIP